MCGPGAVVAHSRLFGKLNSERRLRGPAPPERDWGGLLLLGCFSSAGRGPEHGRGVAVKKSLESRSLPIFPSTDLCQLTPSLAAIQRGVGMAMGWLRGWLAPIASEVPTPRGLLKWVGCWEGFALKSWLGSEEGIGAKLPLVLLRLTPALPCLSPSEHLQPCSPPGPPTLWA